MTASRETQQAWAIWQAGAPAGSAAPDPVHRSHCPDAAPAIAPRRADPALVRARCLPGREADPVGHEQPATTVGGTPAGCSVPTGRYQPGQAMAVTVDWPSAVAMHRMGMTAWACLSLDNLGTVAFQARSLIGSSGRLVVAGDNTRGGRATG